MPIRRDFKLYLNAGRSIPLVINASQYDRGEQWYFTLYSETGEQYYPDSAAIVGTKADGNLIANAAEADSRGYVIVTETEQMTAAAGKNKFELLIDDQTHGTANFVLLVEPSPADEGVPSESDLSLIQQAIDGTSATAIAAGVAAWMSEHLTPTTPPVDASLTVQGAAADAKKTGEEISDLKSQISSSQGMSAEFKVALENLVNQLVYKGDDPTGRTYINALHTAMYPPANLSRIGAVYTQSGTVYDTDSLDDLKADLVVTAYYDNGTTEIVSTYALSGTLAEGTSVITVAYGGKTTTFNVTVTEYEELPVADGVYTPSEYIRGEYIDDTGAVTSASQGSAYIPDFIKVPTDYRKVVEFTNAPSQPGMRNWSIVEYDGTKNFIERFHYASAGATHEPYFFYAVPVNAETSYVRLEWYHGSDETFVGTFSFYTLHNLPTEIGDIDATTGLDVVQPKRLRSGFVPVESAVANGCPFKYEWKNTDIYTWRCYDENHEYLGYVSVLNNKTVTLPTGTAYVRLIIQFADAGHTFASGWSEDVINAIKIGNGYYWLTEE